jgi:hypothetical protein
MVVVMAFMTECDVRGLGVAGRSGDAPKASRGYPKLSRKAENTTWRIFVGERLAENARRALFVAFSERAAWVGFLVKRLVDGESERCYASTFKVAERHGVRPPPRGG